MNREKILVVDFSDPSAMALVRYVREYNVYSEIVHFSKCMESIQEEKPIGIILSNYEGSVNDSDAPLISIELLQLGIPVLGVGYGMHVIVKLLGGKVSPIESYDFNNPSPIDVKNNSKLFDSYKRTQAVCDPPHKDEVVSLPSQFEVTASLWNDLIQIAAIEDKKNNIYGLQFPPNSKGKMHRISSYLYPFLFKICNARKKWNAQTFLNETIEEVRKQVGEKKVLLALSGGIDSTVLSYLLNKAIGKHLTCVFVDTGLMRKNEPQAIKKRFKNQELKFIFIDARKKFLKALSGVTNPEEKRRVIGETFIRVFEESAKEIGDVDFLAQGTIYADVIESGATKDGKLVKSHHNVGGLPSVMDFKGIIEPFRDLLKEEVRDVGKLLGLPEAVIFRQPFPGPGLAIRVIGEVTGEKLAILKEADHIWCSEIEKTEDIQEHINQYFAVLTDMKSVGVKDGIRTYGYVLALRSIKTIDFMSAEAMLPQVDICNRAIDDILEKVPQITRIVFDVTSKPPATIEWE